MSTARTSGSWVIRPKPNLQAHLRLFCFPYAGGAASLFRPWADSLPAEIELCSIQLPGRESRISEPPLSGVPAIVEALVPALRPYVDKPFAFFGHSLGTLICFELARALRKQEQPGPMSLVVAGHRAPQLPDLNPQLHQLPQPAFIQELRRLGGTSEAVLEDPDLMELVMPMLLADFTASETYTYIAEPPLDCPIIVFGGVQDKEVSSEELDAWRIHTGGTFIVRMLPGDHFFLNTNRASVVQKLSQDVLHLLGPGSRGQAR